MGICTGPALKEIPMQITIFPNWETASAAFHSMRPTVRPAKKGKLFSTQALGSVWKSLKIVFN